MPPLFGLAPGGVCHAASVARRAVRSCRTLSPLPSIPKNQWAVCSLWHFPWGCPRRELPGTVVPWSPDFPRVLAHPRPPDPLAMARVGGFGRFDHPMVLAGEPSV
jgi:hypothetical protein